MAAKKPQALKFTEDLENDLKFLAKTKSINYNAYVESVLSAHVLLQKKTIIDMVRKEKKVVKGSSEKEVAPEMVGENQEWV